MDLVIGILQAVLLFIAVAIAIWVFLRRIYTTQLVEALQFIEFDLALRELPPNAVDVLSTALTDGTESIDDVRFGGRSACRAAGSNGNVRMVVGAAIEIRSANGHLLAEAKSASVDCSLDGAMVRLTINTDRTTPEVGTLPLAACSVVIQLGQSSLNFERGELYGQLRIDHLDASPPFARGSFELMLRSTQNSGSVLFVTQGRFGLRM